MQDSRSWARTEASKSDESVVDGLRVIRDSLVEVTPVASGGLQMCSPLIEGKTVNEVAEALFVTFEGKVPEESRRLARELVYIGSEAGDAKAEFMDIHWDLDSAVNEWEQVQKHTEFVEDPDSRVDFPRFN